jgi:hypothetical protein
MAAFRRTRMKTDEELRNLKVDLRRVPEWEAERESILNQFKRFDVRQLSAAYLKIQQIRGDLYPKLSYQRESPEASRVELTQETLLYVGTGLHQGEAAAICTSIRERHASAKCALNESLKMGVSESSLVSLFTSKVHPEEIAWKRRDCDRYAEMEASLPALERALALLTEFEAVRAKYSSRLAALRDRLSLAEKKRGAVQRFEEKHGGTFAKAAAADNLTRSRAAGLKRLVKRSEKCPYCEASLGADAHLDHIYPVSKGGLSIVENLVWCCSACNSAKADRGLLQFLQMRGVLVDAAISRLLRMGKHI